MERDVEGGAGKASASGGEDGSSNNNNSNTNQQETGEDVKKPQSKPSAVVQEQEEDKKAGKHASRGVSQAAAVAAANPSSTSPEKMVRKRKHPTNTTLTINLSSNIGTAVSNSETTTSTTAIAAERESAAGKRKTTTREKRWEEMYHRLTVFYHKNGHSNVPNRYAEDPQLGTWVSAQRRAYRTITSGGTGSAAMTLERASRLKLVAFEWEASNPNSVSWDVRYNELLAFVKKYGHANVPMRWSENVQLSNWVSKQRHSYKLRQRGTSSRLSEERLRLLNAVGFIWDVERGSNVNQLQRVSVMGFSADRKKKEGDGASSGAAGTTTGSAGEDKNSTSMKTVDNSRTRTTQVTHSGGGGGERMLQRHHHQDHYFQPREQQQNAAQRPNFATLVGQTSRPTAETTTSARTRMGDGSGTQSAANFQSNHQQLLSSLAQQLSTQRSPCDGGGCGEDASAASPNNPALTSLQALQLAQAALNPNAAGSAANLVPAQVVDFSQLLASLTVPQTTSTNSTQSSMDRRIIAALTNAAATATPQQLQQQQQQQQQFLLIPVQHNANVGTNPLATLLGRSFASPQMQPQPPNLDLAALVAQLLSAITTAPTRSVASGSIASSNNPVNTFPFATTPFRRMTLTTNDPVIANSQQDTAAAAAAAAAMPPPAQQQNTMDAAWAAALRMISDSNSNQHVSTAAAAVAAAGNHTGQNPLVAVQTVGSVLSSAARDASAINTNDTTLSQWNSRNAIQQQQQTTTTATAADGGCGDCAGGGGGSVPAQPPAGAQQELPRRSLSSSSLSSSSPSSE